MSVRMSDLSDALNTIFGNAAYVKNLQMDMRQDRNHMEMFGEPTRTTQFSSPSIDLTLEVSVRDIEALAEVVARLEVVAAELRRSGERVVRMGVAEGPSKEKLEEREQLARRLRSERAKEKMLEARERDIADKVAVEAAMKMRFDDGDG